MNILSKTNLATHFTLNELRTLYVEQHNKNIANWYPPVLKDAISHLMSNQGKLLRPMMVLLACDLFKGNVRHALDLAYAIELFHNFTLVHDDIMDDSDIRRGKPAVHVEYGQDVAILAGDMMFIKAVGYLGTARNDRFSEILDAFNQAAIRVIEGQQLDMEYENRMDVSEEEYIKMISYKTAALFAGSLRIGALAADADQEEVHQIHHFGLNLGIAFQLKDDWLDTFGDPKVFRKKIGGDILQNKKTYLLTSALKLANEDQRAELVALMDCTDEEKKIREVTALFEATGARAKAELKMHEYYTKALSYLVGISSVGKRNKVLFDLAENIFGRNK